MNNNVNIKVKHKMKHQVEHTVNNNVKHNVKHNVNHKVENKVKIDSMKTHTVLECVLLDGKVVLKHMTLDFSMKW